MARFTALCWCCLFVICVPARGASGAAPQADPAGGTVTGRVLDPDHLPLRGVEVTVQAATIREPRRVVTAADGTFRFDGLPTPASYTIRSAVPDLFQEAERTIRLAQNGSANVELVLALGFNEEVVVTDTREAQLKTEVPATVQRMGRETIEAIKPTHPGQVMSLVPGVWMNATSGEGHQTAIRQPLTTEPVYLYLEDGVPTRSAGFFNHNALYEVNLPAAEAIEVTKGPGSALQGSDAIGGVINVLSRSSLERPAASVELEGGEAGWLRLLGGGNITSGTNGLGVDLNLTRTDGWRDATGYHRYGGTVRWDRTGGGSSLWKTLLSVNTIDQQTAGSSRLPERVYLANPTRNLTPISYRDVTAIRLSTEYQRVSGSTQWSVIPFLRRNTMSLMPNWTLTFDPTAYDTRNRSFGLLAKVRREWPPMRTQLVVGADVDLSPGSRVENQIAPVRTQAPDGLGVFSAYTTGPVIYDYDVTFLGTAPYAQLSFSPVPIVRVSLGGRYDRVAYTYRDRLQVPESPRYLRPDDASLVYRHFSPKGGITIKVSDAVNVFAGYRNAFRVPSEGQLFRQGSTFDTVDLQPVKAHSVEGGLRAGFGALTLELSAYRLEKQDDIISYREPLDGLTHAVNAGRTRHRGIELGGKIDTVSWLQVSANYAYGRHTYRQWILDPRHAQGEDLSGREMEVAPRHLGNVLLAFQAGRRADVSLEGSYLAWYWLDTANTQTYGGHTLVNLRGRVQLNQAVELFARVLNLTDRRYAEAGAYTLQRGREFAPAMPRTIHAGVRLEWQR